MASLGRYELIETLGQGGMGTIHLAVVGGLGRFRKLVVLKVLRDELTRDPRFVEMFMREAALAACLSHPNVVQTVEAGQEGGRYFLVMEFLDGQPYSRLLRGAGREPVLPLALRLHVLCEALLGLHYAHELHGYDGRALHLVHRDVSPPNMFVSYDGQVKLLDFGIANARDGEGSHPGEFKGKLGYAAPEQLRGLPADRRVDVFAAGVVLWESIALRQLTQGTPTRDTFAARILGTEPRISEIVPGLDPALGAICDRAMHTEPEARYASADDFRTALMAYLASRELLVDGSVVAQFMQAKFATVRSAMHRRIDAHSKEASEREVTPSVVTFAGPPHAALTPLPSAADSFVPTPAATAVPPFLSATPLSGLEPVQSRLPAPMGKVLQARRRVLRRLAVISGTVLAIAVTAWFTRSSRPQATAESSVAARTAPRTSSARSDGGVRHEAVVEPLRTLDTLPLGTDAPVPATRWLEGPTELRRSRHRERSESSPDPTPQPGSRASRSVRSLDRSSALDSGSAPSRQSEQELPDLRRVPKRERRQLDVDNPFQ